MPFGTGIGNPSCPIATTRKFVQEIQFFLSPQSGHSALQSVHCAQAALSMRGHETPRRGYDKVLKK